MIQSEAPFRADVVGSFLRPQALKDARKKFHAGEISQAEMTAIEDKEIIELIDKEKSAGLIAITDGEFRRAYWHLDFIESINGMEGYKPEHGYNQKFKGVDLPAWDVRLTGKLSFPEDHPFLAHFDFLQKQLEGDETHIAKATVPSPTMILRQELLAKIEPSELNNIYPNREEFYEDLAKTYQKVILTYYAHGCRYLQFDDTNWAFLIDADKRKHLQNIGLDPDEIAKICAQIINNALSVKPADMTITTHVCRGNHASSWIFSGGYEPVAAPLFTTNYDGLFLEYDTERAGGFAPLKHWNKNAKVVLGLITSKFPTLENEDNIKERIQEATEYIPLEKLCLSPQCGFSSTETGNILTEADQWNKVKLIVKIAKEVW